MPEPQTRAQIIERLRVRNHLPETFTAQAAAHYLPLADWIHAQWHADGARVFGINGAQGSGKSTLAAVLVELLEAEYGVRVVALSIDDFYLDRAARQHLANTTHPLLLTRGVPGTHDAVLGAKSIDRLLSLASSQHYSLPRFIKALDDRAPEAQWPQIHGPVDIIIFEGWCVGTRPQPEHQLSTPVNALEAQDDSDARWRRYVNRQLSNVYADWFRRIDRLVLLKAPDFATVYKWRLQQEQENVLGYENSENALMQPARLQRFLQHYERLTHANLEQLPAIAAVIFELDREHVVTASYYRNRV